MIVDVKSRKCSAVCTNCD